MLPKFDSYSIFCLGEIITCQLLNVHVVSDVRQTEIHTAEPLVPEPSDFEIEMAIEKLERCKQTCTDRIPAEFLKSGGRELCPCV
jgi:hypothetical protein